MNRESILIVDDEVEVLRLLERFFTLEGFPVEKAGDGKEALARMKTKRFNIVLLDICLPDVDGKDLLLQLRDLNPLANIVMITAYTSMDNVVTCIGNGAVDYFTKPFNLDELSHAVHELERKIARWKHATPMVRR